MDSIQLSLKLKFECYKDNELITKIILSGKGVDTLAEDYWGATLIILSVPEDLPLNTLLKCKFEVLVPEEKYSKLYGVHDVYIWRLTH